MIISGFVTEPIFPTRHFQAMKPPSKIVITEDETNVEKEPLQARDGWGLCDLIAKAFHQACGQKKMRSPPTICSDHLKPFTVSKEAMGLKDDARSLT